MRIQENPPLHLTYCLNVHPGESWEENFQAIRDKALRVRDLVGRKGPFGLGLRLSARAAKELQEGKTLGEFRRFLDKEGLYVFTINGFPYGQFHDTAVKENVYSPDWRRLERFEYTAELASILAVLLPKGVEGSISTVPLSYKAWIRSDQDVRRMACLLAEAAAHLHTLAEGGKVITLALEPEPDCLLETTDELIRFLDGQTQFAVAHLCRRKGLPAETAERAWRRHIGVCLDTAHAAVEFEDPAESLRKLSRAGVRVGKVQLSSALRVTPTPEARRRLREFCDRVYLHQVKARGADGTIVSYPDLPAALDAAETAEPTGQEWRIHFHVPLFWQGDAGPARMPAQEASRAEHAERGQACPPYRQGRQATAGDARPTAFGSTSSLLVGEFAHLLRAGATSNVEIETYTFNVLPDFLRPADIAAGVAEEYRWVLENMFPGVG